MVLLSESQISHHTWFISGVATITDNYLFSCKRCFLCTRPYFRFWGSLSQSVQFQVKVSPMSRTAHLSAKSWVEKWAGGATNSLHVSLSCSPASVSYILKSWWNIVPLFIFELRCYSHWSDGQDGQAEDFGNLWQPRPVWWKKKKRRTSYDLDWLLQYFLSALIWGFRSWSLQSVLPSHQSYCTYTKPRACLSIFWSTSSYF